MTEGRAIRPGKVVPDKKEEANYNNLECGAEEEEARAIRPGNVVPDEKEEADYNYLKCGAEEDGGESYPPWQRNAR
jgi:hypothetical protein